MSFQISTAEPPQGRLISLIGLMIVADLLLWGFHPGLGLVVLVVFLAGIAQMYSETVIPENWGVLFISLIPAFDLVQPLSVMFAWGGLLVFCAVQVCGGWRDLGGVVMASLRLPFWGLVQGVVDVGQGMVVHRSGGDAVVRAALDWAVPVVLGSIFVLLFAVANPVIDQWISRAVPQGDLELPAAERVTFWVIVAMACWPLMRLAGLSDRLLQAVHLPVLRRGRVLTEGAVVRSLVMFNLLFALQTSLDIAYLSGGISLPDGISYASYAHRGAYPLLVTALLAGGFALLTQPWLEGRPMLQILLLVWVSQTVLLVLSSLLRLDLYVGVYGLTHLRFAAAIWMTLVAAGLGLMIWQVIWGHDALWLFARSAGLGLMALYVVSLINVDGMIARYNLQSGPLVQDSYYICSLGAGALPAIRAHEAQLGHAYCGSRVPELRTPRHWQEWGFRNLRLRRNLAALEGERG